jgi:hypothetical protein
MKSKILLVTILVVISIFSACDKKEPSEYMGVGVITGFDPRDCACCGGLLINLNSTLTDMFTDSTYQVDHVPPNFPIGTNAVFPIFIRLDYLRTNALCGKTIDILKYENR